MACLVRVEGSRGGWFDSSTLEERRTRRHLYQLQWKRMSHGNATRSVMLAIGTAGGVRICSSLVSGPGVKVSTVVLALPQEMGALLVLLVAIGLVQGGGHVRVLTLCIGCISERGGQPPSELCAATL